MNLAIQRFYKLGLITCTVGLGKWRRAHEGEVPILSRNVREKFWLRRNMELVDLNDAMIETVKQHIEAWHQMDR